MRNILKLRQFILFFYRFFTQMEKWMIVYVLPLEVWMDIFCFPWISRREFGQLVARIGNFKFAEHAQFYLHEWGKRILDGDGLLLYYARNQNGLYKYKLVGHDREKYLIDLPLTPLPPNIKSFNSIRIDHFDARIMNFLRTIQPLLANLKLKMLASLHSLDILHTVLTNLLPLLDGTRSFWCEERALTAARPHFRAELAQLKVLKFIHFDNERNVQENVNAIMDFLNNNNAPKLCKVRLCWNGNRFSEQFAKQLSMTIHEQFLAAKTPCIFAVHLRNLNVRDKQFVEFHLENGIGEELHGIWVDEQRKTWYGKEDKTFQITRHRTNCKMELQYWIEENTNENGCGRIEIHYPTIGARMDALSIDEEHDGHHHQQPSTSKDT